MSIVSYAYKLDIQWLDINNAHQLWTTQLLTSSEPWFHNIMMYPKNTFQKWKNNNNNNPSAISPSLDFPVHFFITQPSLGLKVALMWKGSVYHASVHTVTVTIRPNGSIPPWGWWLCSKCLVLSKPQKPLICKTSINIYYSYRDDSFFGIPESFPFFFRFPEKKVGFPLGKSKSSPDTKPAGSFGSP